jgi:hypothetical protein
MKTGPMLRGFDKFSDRMAQRYSEVRDCLAAGRYEEAHVLLASIAVSHAKTSLSLRSMLIKAGKMEDRS